MILHRHWLENELTQDELNLLIQIVQHDSQMNVDIDVLQCVRIPILAQKLQQAIQQWIAEEQKPTFEKLRSKLVDFTNLQLQ